MEGSGAKRFFLASLAVVAVILAVGVYQVPQPWRGLLVGWLLLFITLGSLVMRLARHYFEYKALKLTSRGSGAPRPVPAPRREPHSKRKVDVIATPSGRGGRSVVR